MSDSKRPAPLVSNFRDVSKTEYEALIKGLKKPLDASVNMDKIGQIILANLDRPLPPFIKQKHIFKWLQYYHASGSFSIKKLEPFFESKHFLDRLLLGKDSEYYAKTHLGQNDYYKKKYAQQGAKLLKSYFLGGYFQDKEEELDEENEKPKGLKENEIFYRQLKKNYDKDIDIDYDLIARSKTYSSRILRALYNYISPDVDFENKPLETKQTESELQYLQSNLGHLDDILKLKWKRFINFFDPFIEKSTTAGISLSITNPASEFNILFNNIGFVWTRPLPSWITSDELLKFLVCVPDVALRILPTGKGNFIMDRILSDPEWEKKLDAQNKLIHNEAEEKYIQQKEALAPQATIHQQIKDTVKFLKEYVPSPEVKETVEVKPAKKMELRTVPEKTTPIAAPLPPPKEIELTRVIYKSGTEKTTDLQTPSEHKEELQSQTQEPKTTVGGLQQGDIALTTLKQQGTSFTEELVTKNHFVVRSKLLPSNKTLQKVGWGTKIPNDDYIIYVHEEMKALLAKEKELGPIKRYSFTAKEDLLRQTYAIFFKLNHLPLPVGGYVPSKKQVKAVQKRLNALLHPQPLTPYQNFMNWAKSILPKTSRVTTSGPSEHEATILRTSPQKNNSSTKTIGKFFGIQKPLTALEILYKTIEEDINNFKKTTLSTQEKETFKNKLKADAISLGTHLKREPYNAELFATFDKVIQTLCATIEEDIQAANKLTLASRMADQSLIKDKRLLNDLRDLYRTNPKIIATMEKISTVLEEKTVDLKPSKPNKPMSPR